MGTILFFAFGLIVGSFLNALIHRLFTGESINHGRSKCPHCQHVLKELDLIPVLSFIFLRGRCRYCGKKISWQYPLVELVTATVFVLIGGHFAFRFSEELIFALVAATFLIEIAVFDFKHYLILDKVLIPACVIAVLQLGFITIKTHSLTVHASFVQGIFGVLIAAGFFGGQYFLSGGRWIGFGDVKLGVYLGLLFGVGKTLMLLFISYLLGAVVGIILIMIGKKQLSSRMPFGTFLAICGIIMLLYGNNIVSWYLKLLGF